MNTQKLARSAVLHGGYNDSPNQLHTLVSQIKPTPSPASQVIQ